MRILQMMLKKDLIHKIMKLIDHYQKEKDKKVIGSMKDELGENTTEFAALRPKTCSYLRLLAFESLFSVNRHI